MTSHPHLPKRSSEQVRVGMLSERCCPGACRCRAEQAHIADRWRVAQQRPGEVDEVESEDSEVTPRAWIP